MAINRWDPFGELLSLREAMGSLFDQSYVRPGAGTTPLLAGARAMPIDLYEKGGNYFIKAHIPGVKHEDVDINIDQNTVTIKSHSAREEEKEEGNDRRWLLSELAYGDVTRTITLPVSIDTAKIEAVMEDGVLTLTIPKAEEAKPKQIKVQARTKTK